MFRALFRRVPLTASLIMLLSVSMLGALPVQAKSIAPFAPCNYTLIFFGGHCAVRVTVQAPPGAIGASTYMEVWDPNVVTTNPPSADDYSIAQLDVENMSIYSNSKQLAHFEDIEVLWIVDPFVWPNVQGGPPQPHLFVFVRDRNKTGSDSACFVQLTDPSTNTWSCGFVPAANPPALPGDQLNVPLGNAKTFYIVYYGGNWLIQYDYSWIGYIKGSWFTNTFDHVSYAGWQGEIASTSLNPTTQMGNGNCGSKNNPVPAHFYTMQVETAITAVDAGKLPVVDPRIASQPKLYNGKFYPTTSGTQSTLAYGGPTGCP